LKKNDFLIVEVTDFYYPEKARGISLLVDAFNSIKYKNKNLKLIIVGGRKYFRDYKAKYASKAIQFAGQIKRKEVIALIKAADLIVHCSFLDNAPISLIEALACGKPIIANEVGAVRELLGEAGIICKPNQLACQIQKTISSPKTLQDLRKKARERSKIYDLNQISQDLLILYNSIIR